jgi:hypothetical protein
MFISFTFSVATHARSGHRRSVVLGAGKLTSVSKSDSRPQDGVYVVTEPETCRFVGIWNDIGIDARPSDLKFVWLTTSGKLFNTFLMTFQLTF